MVLMGYAPMSYTKKDGSLFKGFQIYFSSPLTDGYGSAPVFHKNGQFSTCRNVVSSENFQKLGLSPSDIGSDFDCFYDQWGNLSYMALNR